MIIDKLESSIPSHIKNIIYGKEDAYQIFINEFTKNKTGINYQWFVTKILEQDDYQKCDYYAVYDICRFLIETMSIPENKKKQLAETFANKLRPAAGNNHLAAQCALIMLQSKYSFINVSKEFFSIQHGNALSIVAKKKNIKSDSKVQWSSFFLGLYAEFFKMEPANIAYKHYIEPFHEKNPAMSHYLFFNIAHGKYSAEYHFTRIKNYCQKISSLICLDFLISDRYLGLLHDMPMSKLISDDISNLVMSKIAYYRLYNKPHADCTQGYLYLFYKKYKLALLYFKDAYIGGIKDAAKMVEEIAKTYKTEVENELIKDIAQRESKQVMKIDSNNNFLYRTNREQMTTDLHIDFISKHKAQIEQEMIKNISQRESAQAVRMASNNNFLFNEHGQQILNLHANLKTTKSVDLDERASIDSKLFDEIINKIQTDKTIQTIKITDVEYDIKIDQLLSHLASSKNIHTLAISETTLTAVEYAKIFNLIRKTHHIENFSLLAPGIDCPLGKEDIMDQLFVRALLTFISDVSSLKNLELIGVLRTENEVKSLIEHMQKNKNLSQTYIKLDNQGINDQNLILVADLVTNNVKRLCFSNNIPLITTEGLRKFAAKLRGNKSLEHIGFENLMNFEQDVHYIKACHHLLDVLLTDTNIISLDLTGCICHGNREVSTIKPYDIMSFTKNLCASLSKNAHLAVLNLTDNYLKDEDLIKIAHLFDNNSAIKRLVLKQNAFTHRGLEKLAKALSNKNNLLELEINNLILTNDDKKTLSIDVSAFYAALTAIISNSSCQLKRLAIPLLRLETADHVESYNLFLEALASNSTLHSIEVSNTITDESLRDLIDVVTINRNITDVSYSFCDSEINDNLYKCLQDKLSNNTSSFKNIQKIPVNSSSTNVASKTVTLMSKKATLQTFETIFANLDVNYKLHVTSDCSSLDIVFAGERCAEIVAFTLNSSKRIAAVSNNIVRIANFINIDEVDITSLTIILKNNVARLTTKISHAPQVTLATYLEDVKHIEIKTEGEHLLLGLSPNLRLNEEQIGTILVKVASLLSSRSITISIGSGYIRIANYKNISTNGLTGLATAIQKLITDAYSSYKVTDKSAFNLIKNKLLKSKIIQVNSTNTNPSLVEEPNLPPPSHANKEVVEDKTGKQEISTPAKVECIPYSNLISAMPTIDRFEKLLKKLQEKSDIDLVLQMVLMHHGCILNKKTTDTTCNAYSILYHSIRISELFLRFAQKNHPNTVLNKSSYGMRAILADRSDYFLPDDPEHAIYYLQDHSQSFLTISRQILLDIFENKSFKMKLLLGYSNVVFYQHFYKNDDNPKAIKLPNADIFITDPIAILRKMQSSVTFIQNYFNNGIDDSDDLAAIKGAIFLFGHFARILRDYHEEFCKATLGGAFIKNCYTLQLNAAMRQIVGEKLFLNEDFQLQNALIKLTESQIRQVASSATLIDYCLLFIEARNLMAHESNYQEDKPNGESLFQELQKETFKNMALFLVFNNQLNINEIVEKFVQPNVQPYLPLPLNGRSELHPICTTKK